MIRVCRAEEFVLDRAATRTHDEQRAVVQNVIDEVRRDGDAAVRRFTAQFDGAQLEDLRVPKEQFIQAVAEADDRYVQALRRAIANIRRFHEQQTQRSWFTTDEEGTLLGQLVRGLERVGVYVPGGRAAYPSSVLMNVIPAQVAGVSRIVGCTPAKSDGRVNAAILVAFAELGIREVYRIGGAQAIAALAFGTDTILQVDKIVGPGNIYVTLAKQAVYGHVGIDKLAGPSEILVIADEHADPEYVAADLLSQAEHDPMAAAILVTPSESLATAVRGALETQLAALSGRNFDDASASLATQSAIVMCDSLDEAMDVANRVAPEHLELLVQDPHAWLGRIYHAGAIFLGPYSTEPVGDYYAGTNHILPTEGSARFASALSVDDFIKKSSVIQYGREALLRHGDDIVALAQAEGLTAHAAAVQVRLRKEGRLAPSGAEAGTTRGAVRRVKGGESE